MITKDAVLKAFTKWEAAGMVCPAYDDIRRLSLVDEFLERFAFMDKDTLKYVSEKLMNSTVWPTFSVIRQVAQAYLASKKKFEYVDYIAERRKDAYEEDETFEQFIHRVAEKYYPGRAEEWIKRNEFTLHFYGLAMHACEHCDGSCLHHGHKYHLRVSKNGNQVIPYGDLDLCPNYKGKTYSRKNQEPPPEQVDHEPDERMDPEHKKEQTQTEKDLLADFPKVETYTQQDMFAEQN